MTRKRKQAKDVHLKTLFLDLDDISFSHGLNLPLARLRVSQSVRGLSPFSDSHHVNLFPGIIDTLGQVSMLRDSSNFWHVLVSFNQLGIVFLASSFSWQ